MGFVYLVQFVQLMLGVFFGWFWGVCECGGEFLCGEFGFVLFDEFGDEGVVDVDEVQYVECGVFELGVGQWMC